MISNVKQPPTKRVQTAPASDPDDFSTLRQLETQFPKRLAGSRQELGAQLCLARQIAPWVDTVDFLPFRFSTNLYLVIGVHFTLGLVGTVAGFWSSATAAVIHLSIALLYTFDSARWFYVLRQLLPQCSSQNMIATQRASSPVRKRIVLVAHVDAARAFPLLHGGIGNWRLPMPAGRAAKLLRPIRLAVIGLVLMAIAEWSQSQSVELVWNFPIAYYGGNLLMLVIAISCLRSTNAEVVAGANDNLSGCIGLLSIAKQLNGITPDDVEIVYAFTGCEESGTGGAYHLARRFRHAWDTDITSIIVLDGLGGGELTLFVEGEIVPVAADRALVECVDQIVVETRGRPITRFPMMVGATDLVPFVRFGFPGISLGTIDMNLGLPRHYHLLSDTAKNINPAELSYSIKIAMELCWRFMQSK